jgi:hypothetical protein
MRVHLALEKLVVLALELNQDRGVVAQVEFERQILKPGYGIQG